MCLLHCYTPREELGTAKLFVGMTRNDVTVNIKGGATCNNNKNYEGCIAELFDGEKRH